LKKFRVKMEEKFEGFEGLDMGFRERREVWRQRKSRGRRRMKKKEMVSFRVEDPRLWYTTMKKFCFPGVFDHETWFWLQLLHSQP